MRGSPWLLRGFQNQRKNNGQLSPPPPSTSADQSIIHLQDSPERLEPEIENRIFSHRLHQPSGPYRVLRSLPQRYGRAADGTAGVGGSAFELSLPIDGSEVHLQLEPIDIASPGLTLSFTDDPNREVPAPHNCMFAGASGDTWAVMSVCDELTSPSSPCSHPRHTPPLFTSPPTLSCLNIGTLLPSHNLSSSPSTLNPFLLNTTHRYRTDRHGHPPTLINRLSSSPLPSSLPGLSLPPSLTPSASFTPPFLLSNNPNPIQHTHITYSLYSSPSLLLVFFYSSLPPSGPSSPSLPSSPHTTHRREEVGPPPPPLGDGPVERAAGPELHGGPRLRRRDVLLHRLLHHQRGDVLRRGLHRGTRNRTAARNRHKEALLVAFGIRI
ncbi:hypothetical protein C7M84_010594 [Penaeus vannamei]|uniref:Peptidase M12B propeptide domain-containing protein n=1 Tax=Penaeus vannamei TaxID=6689 RepID=A0A423T3S3_PENVA|nr:hypothetical protein C7M84_010594 [Penaeus vannamei]